ncbi:MAG: hypothetical protein M3Q58_14375 [Bacteroidota bacterium]|nr:hypothetical protein [Bacteroidota bacterium]
MKLKVIIFTSIVLLLTGCYSNDICFESGSVQTIEGVVITRLILEKSDGASYTWKNIDIDLAQSTLNLLDTNLEGYEITKLGKALTEQGDFFINSSYSIINYTRGDADRGKITFKTDFQGLPIEVEHSCHK